MARGLPPNKHYIVQFSRAKSPLALLSKFIMWAERRPFSHVSIKLIEPATQLPVVFQAAKGFVNFFYYENFLAHNLVTHSYEVPVTSLQYLEIWSFSVRKMGSDYGWKELISIGISKLFRAKSWFQNGDKSNICSELAARLCQLAKLPMPANLDSITPSDFNEIMSKLADKGLVRRL